ncbi:SDR family oxidoreductase [Hoeflea ulvae]|uniref:SDR family oxidoreductase n=1 Tax=Hoeflea ulvae TaxID=2983764 RepID=A0ABT3YER2_9HYPH|nr:SDR family oxidoreductase [Hoeflea ulvae]MCY0094388.1 SDR family oxidoreductase [Hoeflea ulvae]
MADTILVTGASGKLGTRVMHHLLDTYHVPASSIIAGSRDTARLAELAARGVETRKVDFEDADGLQASFAGVDQLLIISTDVLDGTDRRLRQHQAAVAAAKAAGVRHILYTSMPNPDDSKVLFAPDHKGTEDAIRATGLSHTIFRNSWYMENLLMSLPHAVASGQWYSSAGTGKLAHIARDDVARAIAASLASPATGSATYTLTGPVAYTTDEIAELVSMVAGKPLAVVHVTDEQLAQGMEAAGVPAPYVPTFVSFDANTRAGKIDIVTEDAATLSGAKPVSMKDFLDASKAALLG